MVTLSFRLLSIIWSMMLVTAWASAQNDITFRVNMRIKILEGSFAPATDKVAVHGDFNNWIGDVHLLSDADGDSIYGGTFNLGARASITYKFALTGPNHGTGGFESDPPRTLTLTGSPQTLPVTFFDRDSVVSARSPVTFRVNMRVKILEGTFDKNKDRAVVRGAFNYWAGDAKECTDANGDSIYVGTFDVAEEAGREIQYKFVMVGSEHNGGTWEDRIPNRAFVVTGRPLTLPVVYFDNDSIVSGLGGGRVLWQVDMSAFEELGYFKPGLGDSMEVRGSFNGWQGGSQAAMWRVPGPKIFELVTAYSGRVGDNLYYKYFMKLNEATAGSRFPGFATNKDGVQYEVPAERGGGNRILTFGGGDFEALLHYFSDINPNGIIPAGKTIKVTFRIDMRPALSYSDPFNPATDSVLLLLEDPIWRSVTGLATVGSSSTRIAFNDPDLDGIWTADLTFSGPIYYNIQYRIRYKHPDGTQVDEGGGLGVEKPHRSRFIRPNGPRNFPDAWTFPVDVWKKSAPLMVEIAPFSVVSSVDRVSEPQGPERFVLEQNFPNPFNPSTTIRYSIPVETFVTMKLYDIVGREVMTLLSMKQVAGTYEVKLKSSDLPSGVYMYRLEAGSFLKARKLIVLR